MTLLTTHTQRYADWQNTWCRDIGSTTSKIVNPPEGAPVFRDVPMLFVRFWEPESLQFDTYIRHGYDGGRRHIRDLAPRLAKVVHPNKVLETANEPPCSNGDQLASLRDYWVGCLDEADAQGIRVAIGHIPEGNPAADEGLEGDAARASERWKLAQIVPAVKECANRGHYLGWHAYWHPKVEGPTGRWHSLGRIKWTIGQFLAMGVSPALKVVVSEFGMDGLILQRLEGWQVLSTPDIYRGELVEAEAFARTIPQIKALCLFTVGWEKPWVTYDHDEEFLRSLIEPVQRLGSNTYVPPANPSVPSGATPNELSPLWLDAARRHKIRYNPGAALRQAIEQAGFEVKSSEWYEGDSAYQWGIDRRKLVWHLFRWRASEGVRRIYSETVER